MNKLNLDDVRSHDDKEVSVASKLSLYDDLAAYVAKARGVAGYPHAQPITHETFLGTRADIFIPPRCRARSRPKPRRC